MLKAILDQYGDSMQLATEATLANGNALANQEKYEQSIAGKTQALTNELSEFWINTINSDAIKGILDELNEFVKGINDADSVVGGLVSTISELLQQILKIVNVVNKIPGGLFGVLFGLTKGKNLFANINDAGGVNVGIGNLITTVGKNTLKKQNVFSSNDLDLFNQWFAAGADKNDNMFKTMNQDAQALINSYDNVIASHDEIVNKMETATITTRKLTAARLALNTAMSLFASVVITSAIKGISSLLNREEEAINKSKELSETFKKTQDNINSYIKQVDSLADTLNDENISTETLLSTKNDLYDLQKDLLTQFPEIANNVDLVSKAFNGEKDAIKALNDELTKIEWEKLLKEYNERTDVVAKSLWDEILEALGYNTGIDDAVTYYDLSHGNTNQDRYKSNAQVNYERWLSGQNADEYMAQQYFKLNVLPQQHKQQYDALNELDEDYAKIVKNGKMTPELQEAFSQRYLNLLGSFSSDDVRNKVKDLYPMLELADQEVQQRLLKQQQEKDNVAKELGEIFSNDVIKENFKRNGWINEYQPKLNLTEIQNDLAALGIDTYNELDIFKQAFKEATESGMEDVNDLFDLYLQRLNETKIETKSFSYNEWLRENSSFNNSSSNNEAYTNKGLIGAFESQVKSLGDYIETDKHGKVKIDWGKIIDTTENSTFFQDIGLTDLSTFLGKNGESIEALREYIRIAKDTIYKSLVNEGMTPDQASHLYETLKSITEEALGGSNDFDELNQSYQDLLIIREKVVNGESWSANDAAALVDQYDLESELIELEGDRWTFNEDAINNLIKEYGSLANASISAAYVQKKAALETAIAVNQIGKTLDEVVKEYNTMRDAGLFAHIYGVDFQTKVHEYTDAELKLNQMLNDLDNDTGGGSGDKDNKSQYDWLDSYLDKRARAIDTLTTAYDRMGSEIAKTNNIEKEYYENLNANLGETNKAIQDEITALGVAQGEYQNRMSEGLLYDNLVKAFGDDKAKANEIRDQIKKQYESEGRYDLSEYTSEQQSALSAIMDVYIKYLDATNKIAEDKAKIAENSLQMFTNNIELITKKFDHVLNEFANRQEQLEHYQTMRTNAGFMENQKYYIALLDNESRELNANIEKRQTLIDTLKEFKVETADDLAKWWETKDAIDATTKAIYENEEAIESYKMSMKQLSWDLNDRIRNITGNLRNETEFLMDTLSTFDADMYDYSREYLGNDAGKTKIYSGKMSNEGLSTLAMRRVRMESFMEDIQALNDEIDQVEQEYLENTANTTILDRLTTLREAQQDLIKSYNQEREAIVDLIDQGYQKQLESLDAISNKYLEAAEQAKALYDRQRDLKKQTKTLSDLRKQLQAYSTDSSEEARAKRQSLTVQLQEAEENLADTQYQHQLDDQRQILDWLYQSLEDYFNDKLEDQNQIIDDTKQLVNDNMPKIKDTLSKSLDIYQTDISQSLKNILSDEGIGAVNSNIAAVDGDIRGITASVTQQTAELERYLAENEIGLPPEETLQDRINKLYGEESTAGSFANYFRSFNDKLTEINNSISKIDLTSKLEDAGKNLADSSSNILDKYLGNKNTVSGSVGTATSIATGVATGIVEGLGKGASVGNTTSLSSTSIASSIISAVKKKYASGVKRLPSGELAWTQEDGLEAILRPTDNAILTPLKAGDSVLTAEATQNLWNFANNPLAFMKSTVGVPNSISKNNGVTFNNAMSPTIIVNGVSNANEFIRELQKNKQFESMMQDMTVNLMNGGASLSKLKYKF